ncbi:hypothetical protein HMPREF1319_2291 [Capnocytophaga ochracea str. Holt 25]|nr:hypothetical protein HMPREF1319_2291 [Capnocytophaga ochracea str. Holt 25]
MVAFFPFLGGENVFFLGLLLFSTAFVVAVFTTTLFSVFFTASEKEDKLSSSVNKPKILNTYIVI